MIKRSILLTSVILLLCHALLCACQKKEKFIIDGLVDVNVRNDLGVSLTAESITPAGGEFVLSNESAEPYSYTGWYALNMRTDEGWGNMKSTDDSLIFTLLLQKLYMLDSYTLSYNWSNAFGELPAGEYRLVKEIVPYEGNSVEEAFYVTCEFTIK